MYSACREIPADRGIGGYFRLLIGDRGLVTSSSGFAMKIAAGFGFWTVSSRISNSSGVVSSSISVATVVSESLRAGAGFDSEALEVPALLPTFAASRRPGFFRSAFLCGRVFLFGEDSFTRAGSVGDSCRGICFQLLGGCIPEGASTKLPLSYVGVSGIRIAELKSFSAEGLEGLVESKGFTWRSAGKTLSHLPFDGNLKSTESRVSEIVDR